MVPGKGGDLLKRLSQKVDANVTNTFLSKTDLDTRQKYFARDVISSSGGIRSVFTPVTHFFAVTVPAAATWFVNGLTLSPLATGAQKGVSILMTVIVLGSIVAYLAYKNGFFNRFTNQAKQAATVADTLNAKAAAGTAALTAAKAAGKGSADAVLAQLQPPTVRHAGFLGPLPSGAFKPADAISQALRAGVRSFVLPIDMLEVKKDSTQFAAVGEPTLLVRDAAGGLQSTNSASIQEVAEAIATIGFRPESPNSSAPILLYLHFNKTPSPATEKTDYMRFLSKVATQLNPIAPFHLGLTPVGTFHRQKQEAYLPTTPLSALENHVIIFSNVDTTAFRTTDPTLKYDPKEDLDFWVNARVYLASENDTFGVTTTPDQGVTPAVILVDFAKVLKLSGTKADNFAMKGDSRIVIALPDPTQNPTPKDIDRAINTFKINMIPIDIFNDTPENIKAIFEEYGNASWPAKKDVSTQ